MGCALAAGGADVCITDLPGNLKLVRMNVELNRQRGVLRGQRLRGACSG